MAKSSNFCLEEEAVVCRAIKQQLDGFLVLDSKRYLCDGSDSIIRCEKTIETATEQDIFCTCEIL